MSAFDSIGAPRAAAAWRDARGTLRSLDGLGLDAAQKAHFDDRHGGPDAAPSLRDDWTQTCPLCAVAAGCEVTFSGPEPVRPRPVFSPDVGRKALVDLAQMVSDGSAIVPEPGGGMFSMVVSDDAKAKAVLAGALDSHLRAGGELPEAWAEGRGPSDMAVIFDELVASLAEDDPIEKLESLDDAELQLVIDKRATTVAAAETLVTTISRPAEERYLRAMSIKGDRLLAAAEASETMDQS